MSETSSVQYIWSFKNKGDLHMNLNRKREKKEKKKQENDDQVVMVNVNFSEPTPSIKNSTINNDHSNSEESGISWKERYHHPEDSASIVKASLDNQLIDISEVLEIDKQGQILEYYPPFDYKGRSSEAVPLSVNTSDEEDESIVHDKLNSRGTHHRSQSKYQKEKKKYRNLLKMKAYLIAKDEFKDINGNIDPLDYPKDLINKRRDKILNILLNK